MTFKKLFLMATVVVCAAFAVSCRSSDQTDKVAREADIQPEAPKQEDVSAVLPANVPEGSMQKTAGLYTVLGLEIPDSMKPDKGPAKIFRFAGLIPVAQLKEIMLEQVRPKWSKKSGTGHIFEEARVRAPKGGSDGKDLLNIRLFKGAEGGSVLDIWIAHTAANGASEEVRRSTSTWGPSTAQQEPS